MRIASLCSHAPRIGQSIAFCGLAVAGVDMLARDQGPMIMEVGASPGLERIERSTGVEVAGAVIAYVERNARRSNPRDRNG